ncbi:MAG: acyltransferase family protein, partial [Prosthecobacter sp.]|nr:acyltransferase family protein [Prosthecobacter sp.]
EWMGSLREDWAAWIRHFFSNLFFLPGIFDLPIAQKNAWSLSYEAGFYIIAALIFAGYQQREKALGKLLLLLGLVASSAMVAHETGCLFFVVGAGVEWLQRRGRLPALSSGIVSAFAAFFGGWLYLHDQVLLSALMVTPFFSSLAAQAGLVAGLLRASVFQWLGQVSYSLYLVHPFALEAARRVMTKVAPGLPEEMVFPLYALCGLSVALLSAALSYAWVEQRLTRFLFQSGRG